MRALLRRFIQFTGIFGLLWIVGNFLLLIAAATGIGPPVYRPRGQVIILAAWMATLALAASKYRWSSATRHYQQALVPLMRSERVYCVVLRPFGADGEVILPHARRSRLISPNWTIEQVVAMAARRNLDLETYAIVDPHVRFAPPGPTYVRASDEEWRSAAERLISRAHSTLLLLMPGREIGEGLAWEIDRIVRYGRQSRVVIVLPPYDRDPHAHGVASSLASVVLARLEGTDPGSGPIAVPDPGYEARIPANTLVAWWSAERSEVRTWGAVPGTLRHGIWARKKVLNVGHYFSGLLEALDEVEVERSRAGRHATAGQGDRPQSPEDRKRLDSEARARLELRDLARRIHHQRRLARQVFLTAVGLPLLYIGSSVVLESQRGAAAVVGMSVISSGVASWRARRRLLTLSARRHELQGWLAGRSGVEVSGPADLEESGVRAAWRRWKATPLS